MHTPNQGLTWMFKFSAVLIICSIRVFPSLCSLPSIPFPLFPSLVPYQKQPVVFVTHMSPLLSNSVHSLPSSSLPTVPCPLSLLTIMFPPSFPIFDYAPSPSPYFWLCPGTLCPWCPYVTFAKLLEMQFDAVSAWVNGPDNYYLCTKLYSKSATLLSAGVPLWNNECSRPLKNGCSSSPPKIMGARRAPKIMGARALKNNGCAPSFFQESISWNYFFHFHFAFAHLFSVWLFFKQWMLAHPLF